MVLKYFTKLPPLERLKKIYIYNFFPFEISIIFFIYYILINFFPLVPNRDDGAGLRQVALILNLSHLFKIILIILKKIT